ncbi:hypothetical protein DYU11_24035 [Fibrisoma montanum]|uniref:Copper chaperone n=1 Tax=Fibrisoma montanum TaxID=2305895 RepID=A0A418M2S4_9BACT|nr:hypothetical protein [Fibrisoma montanum]RIV19988.1 hypothetical protein DYU11_24035 [Fibrisoma montanum]
MVLVFRTSLQTKGDCQRLAQWLDRQPAIERWTIDLDDCDKVLRVVATAIPVSAIETLVQSAGFDCSELPD